jgi:AbrB family looped-hinge helix DNA binding protein
MEITKLSTKGQIVIPEQIRRGLAEGTSFVVARVQDLILLKQVEGFSENELVEMRELNEIWDDLDSGKGITLSRKDFSKEMENW